MTVPQFSTSSALACPTKARGLKSNRLQAIMPRPMAQKLRERPAMVEAGRFYESV